MGRRALPKIDPVLDLSNHLASVEDVPVSWNGGSIFPQEAPLEIEIGTGKGLFLTTAALDHPDRNFLGIEIAGKYARFAAAKLAAKGLPNAIVAHGDASVVIEQRLLDRSLAAVHIYFPDPWWKKRHHKRRIVNDSMVRHIERTLQPEGSVHLWTDVREYYVMALQVFARASTLEGPQPVEARDASHDMDYRTHFERRVRKSGQPVYRAQFRKCMPPLRST